MSQGPNDASCVIWARFVIAGFPFSNLYIIIQIYNKTLVSPKKKTRKKYLPPSQRVWRRFVASFPFPNVTHSLYVVTQIYSIIKYQLVKKRKQTLTQGRRLGKGMKKKNLELETHHISSPAVRRWPVASVGVRFVIRSTCKFPLV